MLTTVTRTKLQNTKIKMSNKRNTSDDRRKKCDKGQLCPYIDEYQHSLEFRHDSLASDKLVELGWPKRSQGKKLGGGTHRKDLSLFSSKVSSSTSSIASRRSREIHNGLGRT